MADYDFGPGLDQAQAAYYHALAASQPSVFAVPGLQDAMGALPNRQGDPEAFARALSTHADANGYQIGNQYILDALGQKQAWDQSAAGVARRFDGQQPNSAIPPFSSAAKDYETADATGRNVALGLLGAGSPGIAAGIAGAYAQPHAENAYHEALSGNYGAAAGEGLMAAGTGIMGALPFTQGIGSAGGSGVASTFIGAAAKNPEVGAMVREAQRLEAKGVDRSAIWNITNKNSTNPELIGAFKGADGQWRVELHDGRLVIPEGATALNPKAIEAPHIYEQYPNLTSNTTARISSNYPSGSGLFETTEPSLSIRAQNYDQARELAAHEFNHAIAGQQNWPIGSSAIGEQIREVARNRKPGELAGLIEASRGGGPLTEAEVLARYRANSEEVLARAAEARVGMTPAQRSARPPWLDYDIPESQHRIYAGTSGEPPRVARPDYPLWLKGDF